MIVSHEKSLDLHIIPRSILPYNVAILLLPFSAYGKLTESFSDLRFNEMDHTTYWPPPNLGYGLSYLYLS